MVLGVVFSLFFCLCSGRPSLKAWTGVLPFMLRPWCDRPEVARAGGVVLQVIRDWVLCFNAKGPGRGGSQTSRCRAQTDCSSPHGLGADHEEGPVPSVHRVIRWWIKDLVAWLHEEFVISVCENTVSGTLRDMGFVMLTARPRHHGQNGHALEAAKKASPRNPKSSEPVCVRKHRSKSDGKIRPGSEDQK